ncbi:NLR family CARD domain-containing protein 4 [Holothuria leucospilota]|uniref:NLR family CARD domain-containing protein 4 n=1 Tax=Holothuria leucospilota TaxID=206669 RepID=A0A9Q1CNL8_HOLLE|nr:NLR family CARD domain-containing protein 4 [Holothuria leucospilota]
MIAALGTAAGFAILYVRKRRRRRRKSCEAIPLIPREQPSAEKIRMFKEELSTKYSTTWEKLYPLPYDETISYPITDLFIEGEIERLENVVTGKFGKVCIWQKLKNHNDFLKSLWQRQSETVLEGEPGFGKTTLGYQLAFDWATKNRSSPLKDIDIYILLRLRYVKDALSIPAAIKKFLLPGKSLLTIQDVSDILYHSQSVVIFLDGYNRFSYNKDKKIAFLNDVRTNNICTKCQVIVTTKPFLLPDEDTKDMIRMRLTGFGEMSWRKYLQKSVARNDGAEEERIMNLIHSNPVLRDLCQVPLFFALFAHITTKHGNFVRQMDHVDDNNDDCKINTVTKFFQTVIDCLQSKLNTKTVNDHSALISVCFDGLCDAEESLIWKKERLCRKLGHTLYQEYLRVGLIVEKKFCTYNGSSQTQNSGNVRYETKVRFPHDVFCEWFAARKLAQILQNTSQKECKKLFEKINPFDHQYVYRFACAFNLEAARKIIKYIQGLKDGEKFAILCILEQPEDYWNAEDAIGNICLSPVVITPYDSLFLQRSTVQLLEFASDKNLKIECVWLGKTNSTFNVNKESLELSSGIILPKLSTLSQLSIYDPGRGISKDDLIGFLEYVSLCDSLKDLRFQACLLPLSPLEDPEKTKNIIGKKPIDVQWEIPVHERNWYNLDIQSGEWRYNNQRMTKEKYDQVVLSFGASFKTGHIKNDFSDESGASSSSYAQSNNHLNRHEVGEKTKKADTEQAGPSTL